MKFTAATLEQIDGLVREMHRSGYIPGGILSQQEKRLLNRLAKADLIVRGTAPDDKRYRSYSLPTTAHTSTYVKNLIALVPSLADLF